MTDIDEVIRDYARYGFNAAWNEPMKAFSPEDFHAAAERVGMERIKPTRIIVSSNEAIVIDVISQPGSMRDVRRPIAKRVRKALGWIDYWRRDRGHYEAIELRSSLWFACQELRIKTDRMLTNEAKAEIATRQS